jgi:hypothetical protein
VWASTLPFGADSVLYRNTTLENSDFSMRERTTAIDLPVKPRIHGLSRG